MPDAINPCEETRLWCSISDGGSRLYFFWSFPICLSTKPQWGFPKGFPGTFAGNQDGNQGRLASGRQSERPLRRFVYCSICCTERWAIPPTYCKCVRVWKWQKKQKTKSPPSIAQEVVVWSDSTVVWLWGRAISGELKKHKDFKILTVSIRKGWKEREKWVEWGENIVHKCTSIHTLIKEMRFVFTVDEINAICKSKWTYFSKLCNHTNILINVTI